MMMIAQPEASCMEDPAPPEDFFRRVARETPAAYH